MNNNDRAEFNNMMAQTSALYGKEMQSGVMQIYWDCLEKYTIQEIGAALSQCFTNTDNGEFMPKPATIIKMLEGSNQNNALSAWTKVYQAIGSVGPYRDVVFDDALIHRALSDMGGWIAICNITDEDAPFRANEFEKRYQGYSSRNLTPEYQNVLTGISSQQNAEDGYKSQPPVLIGDRDQAMMVFNGGKESLKLSVVESTFKRIGS